MTSVPLFANVPYYVEQAKTGVCGTDWNAKYGCEGVKRIKCTTVLFPIMKVDDFLSVGKRTVCSSGRDTDTSFSYETINTKRNIGISLDQIVPESLITLSLMKSSEFSKKFNLRQPPTSLQEYMMSVPEVWNFGYNEFAFSKEKKDSLFVNLFITGNWISRNQKVNYEIAIKKRIISNNQSNAVHVIRFGSYEKFLEAQSNYQRKRTKEAGDRAFEYVSNSDVSHENLTQFNDAGYFLEQANRIHEAITALEKVVAFDSSRSPAHLNLADAYRKQGNTKKATVHYQKYAILMINSGKRSKIPARVHSYISTSR